MPDEPMFAKLMNDEKQRPMSPSKSDGAEVEPPPAGALPDLSEAGYTSHSYRFTAEELRWLRRFCARLSADLDRPVTHNTFMRLLLRLAHQEWHEDPNNNRLRDLVLTLKN